MTRRVLPLWLSIALVWLALAFYWVLHTRTATTDQPVPISKVSGDRPLSASDRFLRTDAASAQRHGAIFVLRWFVLGIASDASSALQNGCESAARRGPYLLRCSKHSAAITDLPWSA
jgi:hypothetical protein